MQSGQTGQSITPSIQPPIAQKPSADTILQGMKDADNPLDFIRNNMKMEERPNPQEMIDATDRKRSQTAVEVTPVAASAITEPAGDVPERNMSIQAVGEELDSFNPESPQSSGASQEEPKAQEEPVTTEGENAPSEGEKEPEGQHFKKLRTRLTETEKTLKEVSETKQKLEKELTQYKTGEIVPEVLMEKEHEIARLSKYEKLHSLKTSKEYQDTFAKPLETVTNKLKEIAADYEVPHEVLNKALNITNRAELNGFLASHFDEVGALEVKQLLTEARDIQTRAREAEAEPAKALNNLVEENKRIAEERDAQRRSRIASTSKETWMESLLDIRKEGKATELIMKENDPEYNEKFVKPYLTAAAVEYGKVIKALADAGITEIPKEVGKAIAKAFQLAHASAVALTTREAALQHASEVITNTKRTNGFVRPSIGGNYGSSQPASTPQKSMTLEDTAMHLLRTTGAPV